MANPTREVEITVQDLPLHCPMNKSALWSAHPRVFLDVSAGGEAFCPYCGTRYRLKAGEKPPAH